MSAMHLNTLEFTSVAKKNRESCTTERASGKNKQERTARHPIILANQRIIMTSRANHTPTSILTRHRHALVLAVALLFADVAFADAMCGSAEQSYIDKLTNALQPYARKVTSSGTFSAKQMYGDGWMSIQISFSDNGRQQFAYQTARNTGGQWSGIGAKPASMKTGEPAFVFYFDQGNIGVCESGIFVKNGKFTHTPIRFRR